MGCTGEHIREEKWPLYFYIQLATFECTNWLVIRKYMNDVLVMSRQGTLNYSAVYSEALLFCASGYLAWKRHRSRQQCTWLRMRETSAAYVRQQPPTYRTPSSSHSWTNTSTASHLSRSIHLTNT